MSKAFTLIEALVAMGIIVITMTGAIISTNYSVRKQAVDGATAQIKQGLLLTRANAMSGKKNCTACGATSVCGSGDAPLFSWRLYFSYSAPGPWTYYSEGRCGTVGNINFWTGTPTNLPAQVNVNTGGVSWVAFMAGDGTMTNSAGTGTTTITISASGITPKTVIVNSNGNIQ